MELTPQGVLELGEYGAFFDHSVAWDISDTSPDEVLPRQPYRDTRWHTQISSGRLSLPSRGVTDYLVGRHAATYDDASMQDDDHLQAGTQYLQSFNVIADH